MPDSTNTSPHLDNMDNNDDTIIDFLVKSLKSVENGIIKIDMRNEPAMQINATTNRIDIDILHPEYFSKFLKAKIKIKIKRIMIKEDG